MSRVDFMTLKQRHILTSSVVLIIGIVVIVAGLIEFLSMQAILLIIGGGLFVNGLWELAKTRIYEQRWHYEEIEELAEDWGIIDIHQGRGRAEEEAYKSRLQNFQDTLEIQAITLTRFRNDLGDTFEEKATSGKDIRLLLMDPDSQLCEWFEEVIPERSDIKSELRESIEYYQSLAAENLEIRLYEGLPNSYFRVDNEAFIGPYFAHKPGRSTVTILADVNEELAGQYAENFDNMWVHAREPDIDTSEVE